MPAGLEDFEWLAARVGMTVDDKRHCDSCRCPEIAREESARAPRDPRTKPATADDLRPRFSSPYIDRSRV